MGLTSRILGTPIPGDELSLRSRAEAYRPGIHLQELEQRFQERMDQTLAVELAKIEQARRAVISLQGLPGQRRQRSLEYHHESTADELFRSLHHLRQRFKQVLGAGFSGEELRQRLTNFYMRVCPSKLANVARIVQSYEARGATQQALADLNSELLETYGCDLNSCVFHSRQHCSSTQTFPGSQASPTKELRRRLAMLSDEADIGHDLQQGGQPEARNDLHTSIPLVSNNSNQTLSSQTLNSAAHAQSLSHAQANSARPVVQQLALQPQKNPLQISTLNAPVGSVNSLEVNNNMPLQSSTFVGAPSPRWARNFSATARAMYPYAAQQADELSLSSGDVIAITGRSADGWFWGYSNGRKGLLPSNFVHLVDRGAHQNMYRNQNKPTAPSNAQHREQHQPAAPISTIPT